MAKKPDTDLRASAQTEKIITKHDEKIHKILTSDTPYFSNDT